jgi:maltose O-acetyltransferase
MLGPYCVLSTANHTRIGKSFRYGSPRKGSISIGKGSWLGAHAVVLKNVKIGSGCVVAANTIVNIEVPDNVAFGSPNQGTILKHL